MYCHQIVVNGKHDARRRVRTMIISLSLSVKTYIYVCTSVYVSVSLNVCLTVCMIDSRLTYKYRECTLLSQLKFLHNNSFSLSS